MLRVRALWPALGCLWFIGAPTLASEPVLRVLSGGQGQTNLLQNPGFELVQNGGFVAWQRTPQGWRVASGEGRLNSQALVCSAPDASGWHGASQTLTLNQSEPAPIGHPEMGTDTMSDIPVRNVQRETFNSQLLTG